jgi:hypothetical protein
MVVTLQESEMRMNAATFSIPDRWQEGAYQIKSWIENYARVVGQPFMAAVGGETDSGQIWMTEIGTLTSQQCEAAENAVHILNNSLNNPKAEPWKARVEGEKELENQLAEINRIFCRSKPAN